MYLVDGTEALPQLTYNKSQRLSMTDIEDNPIVSSAINVMSMCMQYIRDVLQR